MSNSTPKNKKALVTLVIGEPYKSEWVTHCQKNWQRYAEKHGLDIIAIDEKINPQDNRSPAWQKCLVLTDEKVRQYEQVAWVDSDIIINENAPNIFDGVPLEKVGAVKGYQQLYRNGSFPAEMMDYLKTPYNDAKGWYEMNGLTPHEFVVQTGVLVLSPQHHASLLNDIFNSPTDSTTGDYEMPLLSHTILQNDLVHWLDERFNLLWTGQMVYHCPECLPPKQTDPFVLRQFKKLTRGHYQFPPKSALNKALKDAVEKSYFLHFAGNSHFLKHAVRFC